jgi:hypothetical protein
MEFNEQRKLRFLICKVLEMLKESAIQIRTKALKCLASVIEVDPAVLGRVSAFMTL